MSMAEQLSKNSRQGFAAENPPCIGLESDLSRNMHWGCMHVYDETPVGLAVYVRNDPVNKIDPDGRMTSEIQYAMMMGMALPFVNGISGSQSFYDSSYSTYAQNQAQFNAEQYNRYLTELAAKTVNQETAIALMQSYYGADWTGPVSVTDIANLVPSNVKQSIQTSVTASNTPMTMAGDKKGGFHETGGSWYSTRSSTVEVAYWYPGLANPDVQGDVSIVPRNYVNGALNNISAYLGEWHVHPSGSNNGRRFIQRPSGKDIENAGANLNIVVGAGNNTVYFYGTGGRSLGSMSTRRFMGP